MERVCKVCQTVKSMDDFVRNKLCKDGYEWKCKACKNAARRKDYEEKYQKAEITENSIRVCRRCHEKKQLSDFNTDKKSLHGRRWVCKTCDNERIRMNRQLRRREKNDSFWNVRASKCNLRVGAEEQIISGSELKQLYEQQKECCSYCSTNVSSNFHVEHKMPISRGGHNIISNVTLTCPDCNRLKHDKTHEEFLTFIIEYVKRFNM